MSPRPSTLPPPPARLDRLNADGTRLETQQTALAAEGDPETALATAKAEAEAAAAQVQSARAALDALQGRKGDLQQARDSAASALAAAKAEWVGVEREHAALAKDRDARERQAKAASGLPTALDAVRAAPGYERALAAVLGRDAKARLGTPPPADDGRFWTGSTAPYAVPDSLATHVSRCPPQLAARLALVHVVQQDDGRNLSPGEWLVTLGGHLRRWDGFIARGEGAAEAARLEAENRLAELESHLPAVRLLVDEAEAVQQQVLGQLQELQQAVIAADRSHAQAIEAERAALRALDRAEDARARLSRRREELAQATSELAEQRALAQAELTAAEARRGDLPDPSAGRAALTAAQSAHAASRQALQGATAELAAHEQLLAVARERMAAMQADMRSWQARSGDAAKRLAQMTRRAEEIAEDRAVIAGKPAALMQEIEAGEAIRQRIAAELAQAEAAMDSAGQSARQADSALNLANEAIALAREARAAAAARAENEAARRAEMAGISGERFQCPPPLLPERFGFASAEVGDAGAASAAHDRLLADRERIGPVNLVAATELAEAEQRHGASLAEQAELAEAVNRLRGSIGSLNREGRERLRTAFEAVDGHFRRLFAQLFEGGQAHLAMIDSDDPLEAGLEIFAQPPGKRLQSLTLLSGGEQALTAVALIFALFLTNPAPICVLDEVDAPLDDANIERFCDLLDAMTRETRTRYLIVTHNAVTMSRMHRLFGVTMVERGVSRLVSVDLGGAEELLAAE